MRPRSAVNDPGRGVAGNADRSSVSDGKGGIAGSASDHDPCAPVEADGDAAAGYREEKAPVASVSSQAGT